MRVLHIIESLEFGGAEKVTVRLANRLSEEHDVTLCLVKYRGDLVTELSPDINLICLDLGEGVHFRLPAKLAEIILSRGIEVVNVHNWAIFFETYMAVKKAGSARAILTVHGPYTSYARGLLQTLKKSMRHFLERRAAMSRHVCKIVTVSDAIQEYITSDIGISKNKLETIHNGIKNIDAIATNQESSIKLITVGRLAPVKNHKLMIDALETCIRGNSNLFLTIVGDGPDRKMLEDYVKQLGLSKHVNFLGFRNDVIELLSSQDIFLVSSDYEGISIALLESMSLSLPAIATDVGGIPESIHHEITGLIVPKGDRKSFSDAILKLAASTELRRKLGQNAKSFFESSFNEDVVVNRYLDLYRSCLSAECD